MMHRIIAKIQSEYMRWLMHTHVGGVYTQIMAVKSKVNNHKVKWKQATKYQA